MVNPYKALRFTIPCDLHLIWPRKHLLRDCDMFSRGFPVELNQRRICRCRICHEPHRRQGGP